MQLFTESYSRMRNISTPLRTAYFLHDLVGAAKKHVWRILSNWSLSAPFRGGTREDMDSQYPLQTFTAVASRISRSLDSGSQTQIWVSCNKWWRCCYNRTKLSGTAHKVSEKRQCWAEGFVFNDTKDFTWITGDVSVQNKLFPTAASGRSSFQVDLCLAYFFWMEEWFRIPGLSCSVMNALLPQVGSQQAKWNGLAHENPHTILEVPHTSRQLVVWSGMHKTKIFGPYI